MNGILPLLKPAGMTSASCVLNARILLGAERAGHSGTLDPNAAGVLPIAIGRATKLIEYMDAPSKTYRCECVFGIESETGDVWPKTESGILSTADRMPDGSRRGGSGWPSEDELRAALGSFTGEREQLPPMYSSVRVNGRHLYEYARNGESVEVKARKVLISGMELVRYDRARGVFTFDIECSRGTYVRSVCIEIGGMFGTSASMCGLIRTRCCGFDIGECVSFEQLAAAEDRDSLLLPAERAVTGLPRAFIGSSFHEKLFCGGNPVGLEKARVSADEGLTAGEHAAVFGRSLGLLGIGTLTGSAEDPALRPLKVTYEPQGPDISENI